MKKIIVFPGSNSKNSINKELAKYASSHLKNVELELIDLNNFELPLYGIDLEQEEGIHSEAIRLNGVIEQADGFVISLAEHNGSYATVFKNAFDWLSRINGKVWREKPVLLMATSPGKRGGLTVLETAAARFPYMGGQISGTFSLPSYFDNFKGGKIIDEELNNKLLLEVSEFQNKIDI